METIFVGDLSFFCTEENLESLFSSFGVVRSAIIRRGKGGENLQYGFVQMEESEARKAVAQLKGQKFMGRKLRLNIAENSNDRSVPPDRNNLIKVLVSFVSHSVRTLHLGIWTLFVADLPCLGFLLYSESCQHYRGNLG